MSPVEATTMLRALLLITLCTYAVSGTDNEFRKLVKSADSIIAEYIDSELGYLTDDLKVEYKKRISARLNVANCPTCRGVNVLSDRNAVQSGTWAGDGIARVAGFASQYKEYPTVYDYQKCAITLRPTAGGHSWWAADLGREMKLDRVVITGRDDESAYQLGNFYVGVTNENPELVHPQLNNFSVCAYYKEDPPRGKPTMITCDASVKLGRYLVVYQLKPSEHLSICHIAAYQLP